MYGENFNQVADGLLEVQHAQGMFVWRGFSMMLLMVYCRLELAQAVYVWRGFSIR